MDFPDLLSDWEVWLAAIGATASTLHAYRLQLVWFWLDYLHPLGLDVTTVSEVDIGRYLIGLPANGHKRKDATQALRSFFRFLEGRHRPDNPTRDMRVPKPKSAPAPDLPDVQITQLLRAAFNQEPRRGWAATQTTPPRRRAPLWSGASGPWLRSEDPAGSPRPR